MIPESFLCVFSLSIIGVVGFPLEFFETFPVPPLKIKNKEDKLRNVISEGFHVSKDGNLKRWVRFIN